MRARELLSEHFGQHRIVGGAAVLALTMLCASVAGLLRDYFLNRTFPGLAVVDVYFAAFRPSDLFFQMTIMAGYSVALVPLLARYSAEKKMNDMNALLSGVMGLASLVFGILALVLAVTFPLIAPLFVQFSGESLDLYITFGRIALLTNFLFVFGNAFGQYFITVQRYWIYGISTVLYPLATTFGTVFFTPFLGPSGPIVGTLLGALLYVIIRFLGALHFGYRPKISFWHSDIRELGWLMLPRMVALGILQLELLFFDRIASGMVAGSITINGNTRNFQSVLVGVVGISLAQSAYSLLSQAAAKKQAGRFFLYLKKCVMVMLLFTVPGAFALWLLSPVAAALVHLTAVLPVFSVCLGLYALSIPFECINHLLLRSYYSLKNTAIPAMFSVCNGVVAIGMTAWLAPQWGVYALPIGFVVGQGVSLCGLIALLPSVMRKLEVTG